MALRGMKQGMKRGMKRAASAGSGRSAKRSAKANTALVQCDVIANALSKANRKVLPKEASEMLVSMLRPCLAVTKDARHEFQVSVVDMVGTVLNNLSDAIDKDICDRKTAVDGVDGDRAARHTALEHAKAEIAGLEAEVAAKAEDVKAADAAHKARSSEAAAADKALKAAEKEHKAASDQHGELRAAGSMLDLLKNGSASSIPHGKAHYKKLAQACADFEVESDLKDTVLKCLKKEVAARQSFDSIAIETLGSTFKTLIADFGQKVQALGVPLGQAQEAAGAAHVAEAAAGEVHTAATKAHAEATAAAKAGHSAVKAAEKHMGAWLHDAKVTMDAYDEQVQARAALREGPVAAFEALRELQPEPVEPVEPVEPEAPVELEEVAAEAEEAAAEAAAAP